MSRRADDLAALSLQESFGIDEALSLSPTNKALFRAEKLLPPSPAKEVKSISKEGGQSTTSFSSSVAQRPAPSPSSFSSEKEKTFAQGRVGTASLRSPSTLRQSAFESARSAKTLEELRHVIENFDGCDLKKTAMSTVFSDGVAGASVMCIGEAPGADEDRLGKPFVGLSGQLLDKMLATIELARANNVYIGNIIPWRPPGNRTPSPQENALCLPFIERHIELAQPKVLIFLGGTAAKTLLQSKEPLSRLRGKWHAYQSAGLENPIPARVFFHPAYLLRSPGQKRLFWMDLLILESYLREQNLPS